MVRALNIEATENVMDFSDVSETDWFASYVLAASSNGIVNGADGMLRPNDTITREEMSKIRNIRSYERYGRRKLLFKGQRYS